MFGYIAKSKRTPFDLPFFLIFRNFPENFPIAPDPPFLLARTEKNLIFPGKFSAFPERAQLLKTVGKFNYFSYKKKFSDYFPRLVFPGKCTSPREIGLVASSRTYSRRFDTIWLSPSQEVRITESKFNISFILGVQLHRENKQFFPGVLNSPGKISALSSLTFSKLNFPRLFLFARLSLSARNFSELAPEVGRHCNGMDFPVRAGSALRSGSSAVAHGKENAV